MELKDKQVAVIGLGEKTGVETVKFLAEQGANIIVSDTKSSQELAAELEELVEYDYTADLAGHTPELLLQADIFVVSPGVPSEIPIIKQAQKKGIEVISEIELAHRFNQARLIAITGTNGKTTTTTLLGQIFKAGYEHQVAVGGNIGRPLIKDLPYLAEEDLAIAEISSFQLELIKDFKADIALFLNLTPDHLKRHGDLESYIQAKQRLFENQQEDDYTILNYDDEIIRDFAKLTAGQVIFFSQKEELEQGIFVKDGQIVSNLNGKLEEILSVKQLKIKGPHNLENALAAVTVAKLIGIENNRLKDVLKSFSGVEHRIETLAPIDGVDYINDSKGTNPAATMKALATFERGIILIAGGKDKGSDFSELLQAGNGKVKSLILLGETAEKIAKTAKQLDYQDINQVESIKQAVNLANQIADAGDVVLLSPACSSLDMFLNYKERGELFKKAVLDLRGK